MITATGRLVSVIIPTFNRRGYIEAAVRSVLAQTWEALEVIVVDDGSTDGTSELLASISDPRLRCIRQDNHGRSHARNAGLRAAQGVFVAFLDSDDLFLPGKLERQVAFLDAHPECAMVYTAAECIGPSGEPLGHVYAAKASGNIYAEVAFFLPVTITLPTVMLRREVLDAVGLFDEAMERFEDTDMWRRIAKQWPVGAMDEVTCLVRTHPDNALPGQDPESIRTAIEYYLDKIEREDADIDPLVRAAGARRLYDYYANAMLTVPAFTGTAELLRERAEAAFNPLVSIVIPVYNGADFLAEAINSALAQSWGNLEVIVVNDGSTDGGATAQVAARYGERIRYVEQPNGGVASALNRGVTEMSGEFFSWLSHDDLYTPDKVAAQIDLLWRLGDPTRHIIYSDYAVFTTDAQAAIPQALPHFEPGDFRYFITAYNVLHGCTLLIPRRAFREHGGFNPALRTTQDYDLWFRFADSFHFVHLPKVLVKARSHAGQDSLRLSDLVLAECDELLGGFVERLSPAEVQRAGTVSLAAGYLALAINLGMRGFQEAGARARRLWRVHLTGEELNGLVDRYAELSQELVQERARAVGLAAQLTDATAQVASLRAQLDAIYSSRSWALMTRLQWLYKRLRPDR